MIGQTRTKERPQYDCNTTAFTGKNEEAGKLETYYINRRTGTAHKIYCV